MNEKIKNMIDAANATAEKVVEDWFKRQSVEEYVEKMLEKRVQEIVCKLLGFEPRHGAWEVDHCNGRHGESAAGDWLREKAGKKINEWLEAQAGSLPELPKSAITSLRSDFREMYEHRLRVEFERMAQSKAKEDAMRYFSEEII